MGYFRHKTPTLGKPLPTQAYTRRMLSKVHQSRGKISKWNFRLNLKLIISHLIKVYLSIKTKHTQTTFIHTIDLQKKITKPKRLLLCACRLFSEDRKSRQKNFCFEYTLSLKDPNVGWCLSVCAAICLSLLQFCGCLVLFFV